MRIIAEIGSNWKTLDDCIRSVSSAKASGADVIKFQTYTARDLYGPLHAEGNSIIPDLDAIAEECKLQNIELMCTAFSPHGYHQVNRHVMQHKIASSEITDEDILRTVASFKKPVLLSTGGANFDEIENARQILKSCSITLMFCVAEYPARVVDFRHLEDMQKHYGLMCHYGYSDHSTDALNVPMIAKKYGCEVLEKHVNFCGYTDTPDALHSLNGEEFALMVKALRENLSLKETKRSNPWKRRRVTFPDGKSGFYRPYGK